MPWKGNGEHITMDEMARGIATAALTLQSAMLQALVAHGVVSPTQALDIVDLARRCPKVARNQWRKKGSKGSRFSASTASARACGIC